MLTKPIIVISVYLVASIVTYITYAIDKASARKGKRRISESTLHVMSFLGGWPGALIAQQRLRHKTIKKPFRRVYWLTVFLNIVIAATLLSPGVRAVATEWIS